MVLYKASTKRIIFRFFLDFPILYGGRRKDNKRTFEMLSLKDRGREQKTKIFDFGGAIGPELDTSASGAERPWRCWDDPAEGVGTLGGGARRRADLSGHSGALITLMSGSAVAPPLPVFSLVLFEISPACFNTW